MYTQLDAVLKPDDRVLDFGAGRGEHILDNPIEYRRRLFDFRGRCRHVEGCDVDNAVLDNPFVDHAEVISPGDPLPYPDDHFDIIYSRFVFEHVQDPNFVARELLRVVKPGGVIAALTPNRRGYIALAGRAVPNKLHTRVLKSIQPRRKSVDIFPTAYKLNTPKALRSAFGTGVDIYTVFAAGEPGYYFGNPVIYRLVKFVHKHLPDKVRPLLIIFVQKH